MAKLTYSIDSSSLMHGWHRYYRPKNFGKFWERLDKLAVDGRLRASIEVLHELEKKEDELFAWAKERRDNLFVQIDDPCQRAMKGIMLRHPRLVDTAKGRSGGDPFVIALATTSNPFMTVVTEEKPGKTKIPDVCVAEKVPWMGLADLIEAENWQFA
jgi:hypothetical protein